MDAPSFLENPAVSLYCLDLATRRAFFVEVPDGMVVSADPFLYQAQFMHGTHIWFIPFESLSRMTRGIRVSARDLIFIHSVGRCGSTLVSRVLHSAPHVCSLSEPDAFTQLAHWRSSGALSEPELSDLTRWCVLSLCKPISGKEGCRIWAIKFRSQCFELGDLLLQSFPSARHLYLTREPITWLASVHRSFINSTLESLLEYRQVVEDDLARFLPIIRQLRVKGDPMPVWKSWLLHWVSNNQNYRDLLACGHSLLRIEFSELKREPERVIDKIFRYCDIPIDDWHRIREVLGRNSQEGTVLASVNERIDALPESRVAEAIEVLAAHGFSSAGNAV